MPSAIQFALFETAGGEGAVLAEPTDHWTHKVDLTDGRLQNHAPGCDIAD